MPGRRKTRQIVGAARYTGSEILIAATAEGRGILSKAEEVNYLSGPGKGVLLIKLGKEDKVLGFIASTGDRDILTVETSRGAEQTISTAKYEITGRGGKGRELLQRGQFTRVCGRRLTLRRRSPATRKHLRPQGGRSVRLSRTEGSTVWLLIRNA